MAFNFGNMMRTAGHNFMQNMRGPAAPVMNSAGEDITSAFGPQGPAAAPKWGQMDNHDRLSTLGGILGGGGAEQAPAGGDALGGSQQAALAAFLARIGQGGAPAGLPEPAMRPRGPAMDPSQSVIPRRFTFGGR